MHEVQNESPAMWHQAVSTTYLYNTADIGVPTSNLYGWCDSTAVLRNQPSKGSVSSATTDLQPVSKWRYVSTNYNPARRTNVDLALTN